MTMDPFNDLDFIDCTTAVHRAKGLKVEVSISKPGKFRHASVDWEGFRDSEWKDGYPPEGGE